MNDVYTGEQPKRNYVRYVLVLVVGILALLIAALILFDIDFIEDPLHMFLSDFVPPDAFVWNFIKIKPVIEIPVLPSAPDEILDNIVETVIDTSEDPIKLPDVNDILNTPSNTFTPLATITEDEEPVTDADVTQEPLDDLPTGDDVVIPEFVTESNRILSEDARSGSIGAESIGDSFTGTVTGMRDGNSLYIDEYLLVLVGVKKETGAVQYLEELCPVGANAVYDIDDRQSPSRDGGLYAMVWCFVPGLPNEPVNQLMLESGLARVDYSCIGSEFDSEDWLVSAGCPG